MLYTALHFAPESSLTLQTVHSCKVNSWKTWENVWPNLKESLDTLVSLFLFKMFLNKHISHVLRNSAQYAVLAIVPAKTEHL